MEFYVPITYTTTGWIQIKAKSLEDAKKKCEEMNDGDGVPFGDIKDPDTYSECHVDEIKYLHVEDDPNET